MDVQLVFYKQGTSMFIIKSLNISLEIIFSLIQFPFTLLIVTQVSNKNIEILLCDFSLYIVAAIF